MIDHIVYNLIAESALHGAKVHLRPGYDVPEGFPPITLVAATKCHVELYVIVDLKNLERPYLELIKAFCSLNRAEKYLKDHGELRSIETRVECVHAPFSSVQDLLKDPQFMALYEHFFQPAINRNAPATPTAKR